MQHVKLLMPQLLGEHQDHVATVVGERNCQLHPRVIDAYLQLRNAAEDDGINVAIASGFRSLQRQLSIWNRKWNGELVVRDKQGVPLNPVQLSGEQLLHAILHWSALPGSSRHHWGTDFDVYDPSAFTNNQRQLQLVPAEYCDPSGPCYKLWQWLTRHAHEFGFFFPYARYQGGVAQEPWHLSYRPISCQLQQQLTVAQLSRLMTRIDIAGKTVIVNHLTDIHQQYINNICEDNGWTNIWCGYSSF